MVCGECEDIVVQRRPIRDLPGVEKDRMLWSHTDGEPLCPEMTKSGYQPAYPKEK